VATSLKGKGVVAEGTPLSLGCLGVTSDGAAYRYLVEHADLVIFLGAGFNERTSYLWDERLLAGKKVAQVDRDAAQLGKVFRPDVAIQGDIGEVLGQLLATLAGTDADTASLAEPVSPGSRPIAGPSAGSRVRVRARTRVRPKPARIRASI
jgi:thiamine pyrophosphate-dependent acetolactate synthase large subunit-like protein